MKNQKDEKSAIGVEEAIASEHKLLADTIEGYEAGELEEMFQQEDMAELLRDIAGHVTQSRIEIKAMRDEGKPDAHFVDRVLNSHFVHLCGIDRDVCRLFKILYNGTK